LEKDIRVEIEGIDTNNRRTLSDSVGWNAAGVGGQGEKQTDEYHN